MIYFVTGATGAVGRHVVEELLRAGQKVRALTRDPKTARLPPGVEVIGGDLEHPESFRPALAGVAGLHLLTAQGSDYAALSSGAQLADMATEAGIQRVTLVWNGSSGPVEQAFENSDLEWTVLQSGNFMANTLAWADDIRANGVVAEPFVDVPDALIDESDIGAVAAQILMRGGHGGRRPPMTGPELLSVRQQAAILGQVLCRDIALAALDEQQARTRWQEQGRDESIIDFILALRKDPPPATQIIAATVPDILGRPARTLRQWVEANRHRFL